MEEIKVGEYVRTDSGEIFKVLEVEKGSVKIKSNYREWIGICCIKNHSKNIIDLIEVGDYVNGRLVLQVDYKNKNVCLLIPLTDTQANTNIMWYGYEDIKTILTKEQFASLEYKVKEE